MTLPSQMSPVEKARELQAWERLNIASPTGDYAYTIGAQILRCCAELESRMRTCSREEIAEVREAYREMISLRDYPAKRIAQLRLNTHEN